MASYVTTGFSKQLLVYTSYIFYVDPLIRETLSTVISYRKSSPSRPISSSIFCAPHSNLPRIPTLSYRNVIEARKYDQYVPWSHPARKVRCYSREQLDEMMTACRVTRPVSSFCGVHRDSLSRWRWRQLWRSYFSTTNLLPLRKREKDAAGYESRRARENYLTRRRQGDARLVAAKFDARLLWNYGITAQVMN